MKVLHLNAGDQWMTGGTGVAVDRLHRGLRRAGIDSRVVYGYAQVESPYTEVLPRSWRLLERLLGEVTSRLGLNEIQNVVSTLKIKKTPRYEDADLLHLHCLHGQFISYLALPFLAADKLTVFTLHDMWAFTGHCTFSYGCTRFQTGCGRCPHPEVYPPLKRDSTRLEWKLKNWVYRRVRPVFVAPSRWQAEQARQGMLKDFKIHYIPYGVDTEVYRPLDPERCRSVLGIPAGKRVLMSCAVSVSDRRKGGDLLEEALKGLPTSLKAETVLILMGHGGEAFQDLGLETVNLGYVAGDPLKVVAYSAADLFLFPTRAESFGIVSIESQACGTPVVSFRVGGVPEHVRSGVTGYLAEPENVRQFRDGVLRLLEHGAGRDRMRGQCRALVEREYSLEGHVGHHIALYRDVLEGLPVEKSPEPLAEIEEIHR